MNTRYGTSNFTSREAAKRYHSCTDEEITEMIERDRITIGKPKVRPDQVVQSDNEGRYWVFPKKRNNA